MFFAFSFIYLYKLRLFISSSLFTYYLLAPKLFGIYNITVAKKVQVEAEAPRHSLLLL